MPIAATPAPRTVTATQKWRPLLPRHPRSALRIERRQIANRPDAESVHSTRKACLVPRAARRRRPGHTNRVRVEAGTYAKSACVRHPRHGAPTRDDNKRSDSGRARCEKHARPSRWAPSASRSREPRAHHATPHVGRTHVRHALPPRWRRSTVTPCGEIPGARDALKHGPGTCGVMRAGASEPAREAYRATWQVLKPTITPWSRWPEGHAGGKLPVTVGPLPKGYSCRSYGSLHKSARTPSNRRFTHNRRNAVDGEKDRAQPRATLAVHEHHVSAPLVSTSAPA